MKQVTLSKTRSKDQAEIHELIERWARAIRTEDLDGILANHSSEILMFDLPGPVQLKGIDSYKKSWLPFFDWIRNGGGFDLSEVTVTAGDKVAFATALIHCRGTDANGRNVVTEGRLTIGLRKIAGQWVVMHEHHSEPSDTT
jgi:ketosteroid isomerase-like protein